MNRVELMKQIADIVREATDDPANEMIEMGEVLVAVGKALKGQSSADARSIIEAVRQIL